MPTNAETLTSHKHEEGKGRRYIMALSDGVQYSELMPNQYDVSVFCSNFVFRTPAALSCSSSEFEGLFGNVLTLITNGFLIQSKELSTSRKYNDILQLPKCCFKVYNTLPSIAELIAKS